MNVFGSTASLLKEAVPSPGNLIKILWTNFESNLIIAKHFWIERKKRRKKNLIQSILYRYSFYSNSCVYMPHRIEKKFATPMRNFALVCVPPEQKLVETFKEKGLIIQEYFFLHFQVPYQLRLVRFLGLVLGHGYWISTSHCSQKTKYPLTYHQIR